ncbi:hypothetical protein [Streptomyces sp. NPDC000878]
MNIRVATVSALSAVLVAGGATAAVAAPAAAPAKPAITVKASAVKIKLGDPVTFTGHATGIASGSKVTLQLKDGAKWVSLPVTAKLNKDGNYKLANKFQTKGREVLRVKDGATVSKSVAVTIG